MPSLRWRALKVTSLKSPVQLRGKKPWSVSTAMSNGPSHFSAEITSMAFTPKISQWSTRLMRQISRTNTTFSNRY